MEALGILNVSAMPDTFPCLGKIYNCTSDDPSDADIVGIGVVVAFLATIIATYVVILVAYFLGHLPDVNFNEVDRFIRNPRSVTGEEGQPEATTDKPEDIDRGKSSVNVNVSGNANEVADKSKPVDAKESRPKRKKAVEGVILALSDQQLITGLAMLIAGFVKCDISVYLFNNVFALAWFSCTTHLATLTVLKSYLRKHRVVRNVRVIGMLFVAGLLLVSNFMTSEASLMAALWTQNAEVDYFVGADICFYCVFNSGVKTVQSLTVFNILIAIWLSYAYSSKLMDLYYPQRTWVYQYYIAKLSADDRQERDQRMSSRRASPFQKLSLDGAMHAFLEMKSSFWMEIVWLLFAGVYGLTLVFLTWFLPRRSGGHVLADSATTMGFGQLVAILLLCLPCFVALEAFNEPPDDEPPRPPRWPKSARYKDKLYRQTLKIYVPLYSIYIMGIAVTLLVAIDYLTLLCVLLPLIIDGLLFVCAIWIRRYRRRRSDRKGKDEPRLDKEGFSQLYSLKWTNPKAWRELSKHPYTPITLKALTLPCFLRKSSPELIKLTLFVGINIAGLAPGEELPNWLKIMVTVNEEETVIVLKQDEKEKALYEGTSEKVAALGQKPKWQLQLLPERAKALEDILFKVVVKPSAELRGGMDVAGVADDHC